MERRYSASSSSNNTHTPSSLYRRPSFSSSTSSLSPFTPPHYHHNHQHHRQLQSPDRLTPPCAAPPPLQQQQQQQAPLLSALSAPLGAGSDTASMLHPWHLLQGPQPISPPPVPPQISAADLLTLTEASATQTGTYQCSICAKQFGYKNGLIRHVRLTHVGEKPYQCSICNRRFGYKHILLEHQNLHFGNRPYVCAVCDKRFAARSNLIQHQMVHKRPFNCTLCSRRFDREEQLKKHLFVHPDVCRDGVGTLGGFGGVDPLQAAAPPPAARRHHPYDHRPPPNGHGGDYRGGHPPPQRHAEAMVVAAAPLPDSSQEHLLPPPGACSSSSSSSAASEEPPMARLQSMADGHHGNRIDAICSQLSLQGMVAAAGAGAAAVGVTIKQELVDSTEDDHHRGDRKDLVDQESAQQQQKHHQQQQQHHHHQQQHQQQFYQKQSPSEAVDLHYKLLSSSSSSFSACSPSPSSSYSFKDPFGRPPRGSSETPGALTGFGGARSTPVGATNGSIEQGNIASWDKQNLSSPSSSALPGIHEVFSRRTKVHELPSFANFAPLPMTTTSNHPAPPPDLQALKTRHHHQHQHHQQTAVTSNQTHPSNIGPPASVVPQAAPSVTGGGGQRPTAQLPPIMTHPARQTKDQATQHSLSIAGFPSLDDVLSYYTSQGRLFKCQHCNILFFERGMYFLHASLHGLTSPWECSICHKVCSDKNEFTLHFVNQQHNP